MSCEIQGIMAKRKYEMICLYSSSQRIRYLHCLLIICDTNWNGSCEHFLWPLWGGAKSPDVVERRAHRSHVFKGMKEECSHCPFKVPSHSHFDNDGKKIVEKRRGKVKIFPTSFFPAVIAHCCSYHYPHPFEALLSYLHHTVEHWISWYFHKELLMHNHRPGQRPGWKLLKGVQERASLSEAKQLEK